MKPTTTRMVCTLMVFAYTVTCLAQKVSVDAAQVIRKVPSHAVGINMNYLMDGTFISHTTQSETGIALKNMGVKLLRYPGGEKSDNYLWSTPPYTHSAPRMALPGNCQWPSRNPGFVHEDFTTAKDVVLDFDEFMGVCRQSQAEPMIVVAYDAAYYGTALNNPTSNPCGTKPSVADLVTHAAEWVRYANKVKGYNVKYWCIGNESWGSCDYNGCVTPQQYAADIVTFAMAMKAVDPSIKIIVNGRGTTWWQTLLQHQSAAYIDYLGVSCYPIWNFTGGYEQYRTTTPNLLAEAQTAVDAINSFASPADKNRIKVISTEFNAIDFNNAWINNNDMGHALVTFETMGQHLLNPQVEAALLWNTRWTNNAITPNQIYDALKANSQFNANGLALSFWGNNLLPNLIRTAASGTGNALLKSFAVYDATFNKLNVFVINKDLVPRVLDLELLNFPGLPFCNRFELKGHSLTDTEPVITALNQVPEQVIGYPFITTLSPASVTLFQFESNVVLPARQHRLYISKVASSSVHITWATQGDHCGLAYAVQRSENGLQWENRQVIQDRCAKNDEYPFTDDITDLPSSSTIYYRIQITDRHGQKTYSTVKTVQREAEKKLSFIISPNPVSGIMMLKIDNGYNQVGNITIRSMEGQKMITYASVLLSAVMTINIAHLPAGIYLVELMSKEDKVSRQLIRQ